MPIETKRVQNGNGLDMSYLEWKSDGGMLVVMLHGFPELKESWLSQIKYLGERGYWVVAPDQRGYGETTGWDEDDVGSFCALNLARDTVGFIQAIGGRRAVLVGHDFGTTSAFYTALLRPDVVIGLSCMSIPLATSPPKMIHNASHALTTQFDDLEKHGLRHYQVHLIQPETLEYINQDLKRWMTVCYYHASGMSSTIDQFDPKKGKVFPMAYKKGVPYYDQLPDKGLNTPVLPFLDIETSVAKFQKTGLKAPINWYKNLPKNVDDLQLFAGKQLTIPYQFIAGDKDFCVPMYAGLMSRLNTLPALHSMHIIKGVGHWVQQEAPQKVNTYLLSFLNFCEVRGGSRL
eukprot:TRINITY_DN15372_c0_g1_i1.p1 TRINITY_DN15372_c0_g1~~TRINITY_DN15372_c0_g1_i1.p1  ORF type:complete len:357 (+),score=63.03 TRINITY_DN15372_c0_g1_i1:35-1072(+)